MADETHTIRNINWREVFPFTQIFRAFRVAVHPTKLILALAALLSIYMGGRVLDALWPVRERAIPGAVAVGDRDPRPTEVAIFERWLGRDTRGVDFSSVRDEQRRGIERRYAQMLIQHKVVEKQEDADNAAKGGRLLSELRAKLTNNYWDEVKKAEAERKVALDAAKNADDKKRIEDGHRARVHALAATRSEQWHSAQAVKNQGIFIQFFEYQVQQVNNVVWAVMANDWLGGIAANPATRGRPGVMSAIHNFFVVGPWWLFSQHTTYCVLFLILFSIIWAIFGGAISRITAVHVARDEKISLGSAVRFSTSKFLSFIFAPIIPLLIVLVVGLLVALGGLVGNVPWIGPALMGIFFFLALAAGFVMTLVLLGTIGGFNLMYPTIAVEGSDSFDAISRSFSYVYARPWRMILYTLIALVYGALCFFFVRFFIHVMMLLTHYFVGKGMFVNVDGQTPIDLWNTMWPPPGSRGLTYDIDTMTLHGDQIAGAYLMSIWVYLTVGLVGAFAISFYFSANTIIYYLMRREVDATELDDVYLEQADEDFTEAPVAAPAGAEVKVDAPAATPGTPPAGETPPPANG